MQLTRFTDLGVRAMMLLAAGEAEDQRVTVRAIAVGSNASQNHVAKAVSKLVDLEIVSARRGRTGGLTLTDAGRRAPVGWLIRRLEGDREVIECVGDRPCPLMPGCRLRRALAEAKEAFYRELDRYTIDDLVGSALVSVIEGTSVPLDLQLHHQPTERTAR